MLLASCLETRTLASWWGVLLWKWDCFPSVIRLFRKDLILIVLSRTTYSSMKQEALSSQISGIRLRVLEHHFLPNWRCKLVDTYTSTYRQKLIHLLTMWLPQVSLYTRERPGLEIHCVEMSLPILRGSWLHLLSVACCSLTQMLFPVPIFWLGQFWAFQLSFLFLWQQCSGMKRFMKQNWQK